MLESLPPVLNSRARLLVLGSFPGGTSLARGRYYAHPRNQFWPILGSLIGVPLLDETYTEQLAALQRHGIALWDVFGCCRRQGSLDSSIREAALNDFDELLIRAPALAAVAFNGATAGLAAPFFIRRGLATYCLPSTSAAYASLPLKAKIAAWRVLVTDGWVG